MIGYIAGKLECDMIGTVSNKMFGYPSKGKHVGGGSHVTMTDVPGIGWTLRHANVMKHPTKEQWAYPIDNTLSAAIVGGGMSNLDVAESTSLVAALADAKQLSADWTSDAGEPRAIPG